MRVRAPNGLYGLSLGFNPELYTEFEEKAAPVWKGAGIEYFRSDRLEAYPTSTLRRAM
jgi:hypothetical protein